MRISDEMRTAAREAIYSVSCERLSTSEADAVIAAVAPLILEEAAKCAEGYADAWDEATVIAARIRALTSPQADQPPAAS